MRKREEKKFYPELDRYRMRKDPNFGKEKEEEEEEGEGFAARRVTEASISHRNTHPLTHTSCPIHTLFIIHTWQCFAIAPFSQLINFLSLVFIFVFILYSLFTRAACVVSHTLSL